VLLRLRRAGLAPPSLGALIALAAAFQAGLRRGDRLARVRRSLEDRIAARQVDEAALRQILGDLPAWVRSPDSERAAWVNRAAQLLWPQMSQAISRTVKNALQRVLQNRKPHNIHSIAFETFALGDVPPQCSGARVHQTGAEEVMLDVDVSWAAPLAEAVLAVKLTQGAPPFPVQLSEILFSGTVRIIFRPLMPYWPCFAGVSVSFVGRPQVDFSLRLIGGELMSVPGLAHAMNDLIKHRVLSLMVWPRCVVAPVRKGLNLRNLQTILARPAGILRCHIVQARGLRAKHFTGVYVTLELGGVLRDSRVMGSSVDVGWKRERIWDFVVQEPDLEGLRVTLQEVEEQNNLDAQMLSPEEHLSQLRAKVEDNDLSLYIRRIGEAIVPVSSLPYCKTVDRQCDLGDGNGAVSLDLQYIPFGLDADSEAYDDVLTPAKSAAPSAGRGRGAAGVPAAASRRKPAGRGDSVSSLAGGEGRGATSAAAAEKAAASEGAAGTSGRRREGGEGGGGRARGGASEPARGGGGGGGGGDPGPSAEAAGASSPSRALAARAKAKKPGGGRGPPLPAEPPPGGGSGGGGGDSARAPGPRAAAQEKTKARAAGGGGGDLGSGGGMPPLAPAAPPPQATLAEAGGDGAGGGAGGGRGGGAGRADPASPRTPPRGSPRIPPAPPPPLQEVRSFQPREHTPQTGVLAVSLYGARGLVSSEWSGLGEPYVRLVVGGRVLESRALPRRSSRGWVENFQVTIVDTAETPGLAVEVWDKAGGFVSPLLLLSGDRDSLIGLQTFSVYDLISLHIAKGKPKWYPISAKALDGSQVQSGELLLDFQWYGAPARTFYLTAPAVLGEPSTYRSRAAKRGGELQRRRRRRNRLLGGFLFMSFLAASGILVVFLQPGSEAALAALRAKEAFAQGRWLALVQEERRWLALRWAGATQPSYRYDPLLNALLRELRAGAAAARAELAPVLRAGAALGRGYLRRRREWEALVAWHLGPTWAPRLPLDAAAGALLALLLAVAAAAVRWVRRGRLKGALSTIEGPGAWFSMDRAKQEFVTQQMVMGRARQAAAGGVPGGVAVPGGARRSLAPVGAPGAAAPGAAGAGAGSSSALRRKAAALGGARAAQPGGGAAPAAAAARPPTSSPTKKAGG